MRLSLPLFLLLATFLGQLSLTAQTSNDDAKLLGELTQLEKASWDAAVTDNKEFFRSYMAPEFKGYFADGTSAGREDFLRSLDDFHLTKYNMSNVSLIKINDDAAMLLYTLAYEGAHRDHKVNLSGISSSSLYVRRGGKWLEYFYQETAAAIPNHGSADDAKALVAKTIALINKEGTAAFAKINAGQEGTRDRDLYAFVHSTGDQAKVLSYGGPKLDKDPVGRPVTDIIGFAGKPIGKLTQELATEQGAWLDYKWLDPATGKVEQKFTWVVRSGNYIVGCGVYGSGH